MGKPTQPPLRALVVEDDPGVRVFLTNALEDEGLEVTTAEHGDAAYAALEGPPFALVLSDRDLGPGPSGLDVISRARARSARSQCVLLSAHITTVQIASDAATMYSIWL